MAKSYIESKNEVIRIALFTKKTLRYKTRQNKTLMKERK